MQETYRSVKMRKLRSAISLLGLLGGWNIIGNLENAISADTMNVDELKTPTPQAARPTSKPWPTIAPLAQVPRLNIKPLPTLPAGGSLEEGGDSSDMVTTERAESFNLPTMSNAEPLPTLAPLPTLPEYVPPPPPPPSMASSNTSNNVSGGGNRSKGS